MLDFAWWAGGEQEIVNEVIFDSNAHQPHVNLRQLKRFVTPSYIRNRDKIIEQMVDQIDDVLNQLQNAGIIKL